MSDEVSMINPQVETLLKATDHSKFALVTLGAKRALSLIHI